MKKFLLVIMFLMTSNYVSADNNIFYQSQAPMLCTTAVQMNEFLDANGMKPHSIGLGRNGGSIDGDIVFAISHWLNEDGKMMAIIETPAQGEKCIVYGIFDYKEVNVQTD
jgi:hypothetical protein